MTIHEITQRTPAQTAALLAVWEASVRATHTFLSEEELLRIRNFVPAALDGVEHLILAEKAPDRPVAFMGITKGRLEMLFLSPEELGKGLGRRLLTLGIDRYGVKELTVNEENPSAVGFYTHMGFRTYRRTPLDEEGDPYPLLYMKRN